jgi:hypothetical protein
VTTLPLTGADPAGDNDISKTLTLLAIFWLGGRSMSPRRMKNRRLRQSPHQSPRGMPAAVDARAAGISHLPSGDDLT